VNGAGAGGLAGQGKDAAGLKAGRWAGKRGGGRPKQENERARSLEEQRPRRA